MPFCGANIRIYMIAMGMRGFVSKKTRTFHPLVPVKHLASSMQCNAIHCILSLRSIDHSIAHKLFPMNLLLLKLNHHLLGFPVPSAYNLATSRAASSCLI